MWRTDLAHSHWTKVIFLELLWHCSCFLLSNVCSHGSNTRSVLLPQTTTTLGSSWTVFWVWRSTSRTPCSSTSLTRWEPSSRRPRRTADTTWAFLVSRSLFTVFFPSVFTNTEAKLGRRFFGLISKVSTISEDLCLMSCIRSGLWWWEGEEGGLQEVPHTGLHHIWTCGALHCMFFFI